MSFFRSVGLIAAGSMVIALTGCGGDSNNNNDDDGAIVGSTAIIQTAAPDYSGSDVQVVDLSSEILTASDATLSKDQSDYSVEVFGETFFHIGRFGIDTFEAYDVVNIDVEPVTLATKDGPESDSSNVQAVAFASSEKAYLIGLGNDSIWIVNPKAQSQEAFKLGEIDISAYADEDGLPEAVSGVVVDGKLYVVMQRIDRINGWSPVVEGVDPYIAVFDIETDTEIDTNPNDDENNLKGMPIAVRNPLSLFYNSSVGLFVVGSGDPNGAAFYGRPLGYEGGILKVDTTNFTTEFVIDDGTDAEGDHPYGYIINATVIDSENGYFVGQESYQVTNLFHFNPTTGDTTQVSAYNGMDLGSLTTGPKGRVWLGIFDAADPRIELLNADQTVDTTIAVEQNPKKVVFSEAP